MDKPKLVAFNMYETRIDSGSKISPYKTLFSSLGIQKETAMQISKTLMTSTQNIENILPPLPKSPQEIQTAIDEFYHNIEEHLGDLKIYPDFIPTIQQLKSQGYKTAVISNLSKLYAYPFDYMIDKDTFDYKALSFETGLLKPDTAIFEHILKESKTPAQDTIMIGNSLRSDVQGAFNTHINPVHINRSANQIKHHGWYTEISSLEDLFSLLSS